MVTSKRYRLAIGLILAGSCLPGLSVEPNEPQIKLKYSVVKGAVLTSRFEKEAPILPAYMARFTVRWYFAPPDDPNVTDLLETPAGKTLSVLQQEFMKSNQANWLWSHVEDARYDYEVMGFIGLKVPQGHKGYHAYAVSREDAFTMAAALVEFMAETGTDKARRGVQQHIEKLSEKQRQLRARVTKTKEEAAAKDNKAESVHKEYEEAVRDSFYSLQRVSDVPNELRKTILEMDRMLNVLNIEIVGIKSKISAIKKYSTQKDVLNSKTLTLTLREMSIREEIELAGAESRSHAIINVKERQEALYDLYEKSLTLKGESDDLTKSIKRDENNINMIEKELTRWVPGEPLFLIENKNMVSIRPLRIE